MERKKRSMSSHVSSRWYRAPEISLIESQYDQASDMWSVGCILYELLSVSMESQAQIKANKDDQWRHILFKGKYSFPLSPNPKCRDDSNTFDKHDQMFQVLQQMDKLTDYDLSGYRNSNCRQYMATVQQKAHESRKGTQPLQNMLENDQIPSGFRDILSNILCVNPYFRWTAAECLEHPIFDDVRHESSETPNKHKIKLDLDTDDAYDYEESKSEKYTKQDLLKIL